MPAPKHRANKVVRTEPRVQPAGKHVGPTDWDRTPGRHELNLRDLMQATFVGNPYRGRA